MPECGNCGTHVTERYLRVMEPDDRDTVRCCPSCPDLMWESEGGSVREAKSSRRVDR